MSILARARTRIRRSPARTAARSRPRPLNDSLEDVVTECLGVPAVITGTNRFTRQIYGTGFGLDEGLAQLEVDPGTGWAVRATDNWFDTLITHSIPILNLGDKIRVRTACGAYSNVWVLAALLDEDGNEVTEWPWPVPVPVP